jgi:hypothetical protein
MPSVRLALEKSRAKRGRASIDTLNPLIALPMKIENGCRAARAAIDV